MRGSGLNDVAIRVGVKEKEKKKKLGKRSDFI
jgi:hypothetical protein